MLIICLSLMFTNHNQTAYRVSNVWSFLPKNSLEEFVTLKNSLIRQMCLKAN